MSHFSELDAVHRQRHTRPVITEEALSTASRMFRGAVQNLDPDYNHCPEDQIPYSPQEWEDNKGDLICHQRREEP